MASKRARDKLRRRRDARQNHLSRYRDAQYWIDQAAHNAEQERLERRHRRVEWALGAAMVGILVVAVFEIGRGIMGNPSFFTQ